MFKSPLAINFSIHVCFGRVTFILHKSRETKTGCPSLWISLLRRGLFVSKGGWRESKRKRGGTIPARFLFFDCGVPENIIFILLWLLSPFRECSHFVMALCVMYRSNRSFNMPPRATPRAFDFFENYCSNSPLPEPKCRSNAPH